MARYLVTGGCGMIGSNLVHRLVKGGDDVSVVDNLWRGKLENLKDADGKYVIDIESKFHKIDLSSQIDINDILKEIDFIVHLADIVAGIGYVFSNQGFIFRKNILINSNVINAAKNANLKGFIYVGTACSFPEFKQNTFEAYTLSEKDLYPAQPESAYGWSKLMGQYETALLEKEHNIPTTSLMLHNVYGTPCDYSLDKSQVIPSLIRKAINYPAEEFVVWGSGNQGRAFLHVDDVVDGIILSIEKGLGKGTVQLGPSECTSVKTLAEIIKEISGKNLDIKFDLSKPEGDKSRAADCSKAREVLNWTPQTSLMEGLRKVYLWIEEKVNNSK